MSAFALSRVSVRSLQLYRRLVSRVAVFGDPLDVLPPSGVERVRAASWPRRQSAHRPPPPSAAANHGHRRGPGEPFNTRSM